MATTVTRTDMLSATYIPAHSRTGASSYIAVPSLSASTFPYRYIDLHLRTVPYRYIDPLLNDSAQATPVTDGYAVGVTLLQALTGRPVANLKVLCRTNPNPDPDPDPKPEPEPDP